MKLWKVQFVSGSCIVYWQKYFRTYRHAISYLHQKTEEARVNRCEATEWHRKNPYRILITSVNGFGKRIEEGFLSIEEIETED